VQPEEAVRAYHGVLQKLGIRPHRSLEADMQLQTNVMSYGGSGTTISIPEPTPAAKPAANHAACPCQSKPAKQASPSTNGHAHGSAACQCGPHEHKPAEQASPTASTNGVKPSTDGEVDFSKLSSAQKIAYHRAKWDRILG
jgi:hypothetical protein